MDKFRATALLHGYHPEEEGGISLANMAWFNGAAACKKELRLESVLEIVGDRQKIGKALLAAVQNIKGVAGSGIGPLCDQRTILSQIRKQPRFQKLNFESWIGACAVAGWLGYEEDHLVSDIGLHDLNGGREFDDADLDGCLRNDNTAAREFAFQFVLVGGQQTLEGGRPPVPGAHH